MAQFKFSKRSKKRIYAAHLLYFILCTHSSQGFANTLLTVPPNQAAGVVLTQAATPIPPNLNYNSLDIQANGSVTPGVFASFQLGNHVSLTIQVEGGAVPGAITHNVNDGASTINSTFIDTTAQLWIVNSGIITDTQLSAQGTSVFNLLANVPTRIYNLSSPTAPAQAPASLISPNGISFYPTGNIRPVYVQLGVNTALQQDTLPAIIGNPMVGPFTQPLGGNGNADAVSPTTPFGPIFTGAHTTLFVQGTFILQNSLSAGAGNVGAGIIRTNTYAGSPGFTISSAVGTVAIPIAQFSQEGGNTNIVANGNVITTLYNGLGGLLTVSGGGRLNATTLNNNAGTNIVNNFNSFITTTTATNNGIISNSGTFAAQTFTNGGIFNSISGGTFTAVTLHNTNIFNANNGSVLTLTNLQNSGTFTLGTNLNINGNNFANTGTFNILNGGVLHETAGQPLVNQGLLNINNGGTVNAVTINNVNSTNYFAGGSVIATNLINSGTFNANIGTLLNLATLTNSGIFNSFGSVATQTLSNSGTFNANTGSTLSATSLTNSGTFNLGTALSIVGTNSLNSGTFNINNGGALAVTTSPLLNTGTVTLNPGGSFTGTLIGNGGNSTFNINTTLVSGPNVVIGVLGAPIGFVNINPGGTLFLNNSLFTDPLNNNGSLVLINSQNVFGNYFQGSGGSLSTTIQSGTPTYGQLIVNGLANVGGSINVNYTNSGIGIANGQTFDVIISNGLTDNNPAILSQPNPFLSFVRDRDLGTPSNNVRIKAVRGNPIPNNPSISGVANTIQFLFGNVNQFPVFLPLLQRIAANPGALVENLTQLIPIVNGMESIPALYNPYPLFDKIFKRIEDSRFAENRHFTNVNFDNLNFETPGFGYSAGDMIGNNNSIGPILFGNLISQGVRDNIDGYDAATLGLAFVGDSRINSFTSVGAGVSYSGTSAGGKQTGNSSRTDNIQAMAYGSLDYDNFIFLDGVVSIAENFFKTTRSVPLVAESAKGTFCGIQPSLKARTGINFLMFDFELTPLATIFYSRVHEGEHTEKGAPITDLKIQKNYIEIFEGGAGLKLAWVRDVDDMVPEVHVLGLKNFKTPNFAITSQFIAGGPPFLAIGPKFASTGIVLGGSLTLRATDCILFMGTYDFESRNHFRAQTLSLKFRMLF